MAKQLKIAETNPLRYRGCYYDNETGYYYLQSRYNELGELISTSGLVNATYQYDSRGNITSKTVNDVTIPMMNGVGGGKIPVRPEIDKGKVGTVGYYWHYHTYDRNGAHVFYLW